MLLANMSVARCISEAFPDGAMLRRHPPPRQMAVDELVSNVYWQLNKSTQWNLRKITLWVQP